MYLCKHQTHHSPSGFASTAHTKLTVTGAGFLTEAGHGIREGKDMYSSWLRFSSVGLIVAGGCVLVMRESHAWTAVELETLASQWSKSGVV